MLNRWHTNAHVEPCNIKGAISSFSILTQIAAVCFFLTPPQSSPLPPPRQKTLLVLSWTVWSASGLWSSNPIISIMIFPPQDRQSCDAHVYDGCWCWRTTFLPPAQIGCMHLSDAENSNFLLKLELQAVAAEERLFQNLSFCWSRSRSARTRSQLQFVKWRKGAHTLHWVIVPAQIGIQLKIKNKKSLPLISPIVSVNRKNTTNW